MQLMTESSPSARPGVAHRMRRAVRDLAVARFAAKLVALNKNRDSVRERPREALRYLAHSQEISNWTYDLENEAEALSVIAELLSADPAAIGLYRDELRSDTRLLHEIEARLKSAPRRDPEVRYGYRIMHYCLARAMKPQIVAELGVHDGLGAAVMLRALEKNTWEGYPGLFLAFDDSPESGWLIPDWLREGMVNYLGDATELIEDALDRYGVDILLQDIGPGIDTETQMFEAAIRKSRGPLVLRGEMDDRDNLRRFTERCGGRFVGFQERPKAHFWTGTRIGMAIFDPETCGKVPPSA